MPNVYGLRNSEYRIWNARSNLLPRIAKLRIEVVADAGPSVRPVAIVETEEREETSLSGPPSVIP